VTSGGILEEFVNRLLGVSGNLTRTGEALPDGTALPDAEQRAQDQAFLDDLADLVVHVTTGRAHDEKYLQLVEVTRKLFNEPAKQWYDAWHSSGLSSPLCNPTAVDAATPLLLTAGNFGHSGAGDDVFWWSPSINTGAYLVLRPNHPWNTRGKPLPLGRPRTQVLSGRFL
jgi:hypothetical protein